MVDVLQGKEYYSAEEACAALGVKPATLYSYVNRGLIKSYRQGIRRQRLYLRSEVDDLLRVIPAGLENPAEEIPRAETWTFEH
ncbi:MAG TPA: helix-turn-helix domain-containing protein [Chloroflexota bacterium]